MKRLIVYWMTGCTACEEALAQMAGWFAPMVVVDKRNLALPNSWTLPDDKEIRLTPTYVLTDSRGHHIATHEGAMSLSELNRFVKKQLEAA